MKQFIPQEVKKSSGGEPIMGFVIKNHDLETLEKQIDKFTDGNHVLAIKEEANDMLRVALFLTNPNPPPEIIESIKEGVEKIIADQNQTKLYSTHDNYEPQMINFSPPKS